MRNINLFIVKNINRLLAIKNYKLAYIQPTNIDPLDQFMAENYPNATWQQLSRKAKNLWVDVNKLFQDIDIQTVAYIGAYNGANALALQELYPHLVFYLFEPQAEIYKTLEQNTNNQPNMHAFEVAIGAENAQLTMHIDIHKASSSLLSQTKLMQDELPFVKQKKLANTKVRRLDDLLHEQQAPPIDLMIIDTQGYEDKVFEGASQTLKHCKAIICEMSLQPLYEKSSTFESVYETLQQHGFKLHSLFNPMKGQKSWQILQIDGIFIRA